MTQTRRQVLIVDDDPAIRTLLRLVAERRGYAVDVAVDGVEAMRLLTDRIYDLAIVDLMMPRVNGYELVDAMRRLEGRPAVVIATAMTDSLIGLLDAEIVHSIIRKPFDIDIVGALMTAIVDSRPKTAAAVNDAAAEEALELPPPPPPGPQAC